MKKNKKRRGKTDCDSRTWSCCELFNELDEYYSPHNVSNTSDIMSKTFPPSSWTSSTPISAQKNRKKFRRKINQKAMHSRTFPTGDLNPWDSVKTEANSSADRMDRDDDSIKPLSFVSRDQGVVEERSKLSDSQEPIFLEANFIDTASNSQEAYENQNESQVDPLADEEIATSSSDKKRTKKYKVRTKKHKVRTEQLKEDSTSEDSDPFAALELQELAEESSSWSPELIKKMHNLEIDITWDVPELHHLGLKYQKSEKNNSKIAYSKEENQCIRNRWKEFCKLYGFKHKECIGFFPNPKYYKHLEVWERVKFFMFIGQDLPNRLLNSIKRRFTWIFSKFSTTRFSEAEDNVIMVLYNKRMKNLLSVASRVLKRSAPRVMNRLEQLVRGRENNLNITHLIRSVMKSTGDVNFNNINPRRINWEQVAKDYNRKKEFLQAAWHIKIMPCILSKKGIARGQLKINLIQHLKEYNWKTWDEISWKTLSTHNYSLNIGFLYSVVRKMIKKHLPPEQWNDLPSCVNHLYTEVLPTLVEKSKLDELFLKKVSMERGFAHLRHTSYIPDELSF